LATTRHDCRWRREADRLREQAAENQAQLTAQAEQVKALLEGVDQMEH
jgi:hypothetical protein